MSNKTALIILDGWGIGDQTKSDVIHNARTPFVDQLIKENPTAQLLTDGLNVGLPEGQMGNSEVGHLNIGAGRIVYQELTRINKSIEDGSFFKNEQLLNAFTLAKEKGSLHLMGLVSKGGVHSSQEHLYALCKMAEQHQIENVYIHAFTDGRDCDPKSGLGFIQELESQIAGTNIQISSVIGRYFAMDRDKRWERIQKAYNLLVNGIGESYETADEAILASYNNDETDEFINPKKIVTQGSGTISENDVVICFNFRTDRCREITTVLTQKAFPELKMQPLALSYFTMTEYDKTFKNVHVIFENDNLKNTLGEVIQDQGLTQLRIAETEKYPHVTFFFSGGREIPFDGEQRIMVNSPKVATYDLQPEMSAPQVTEEVINAMSESQPDFICLNFANPDMVGHTGVYEAIVKAVETIDECTQKVVDHGLSLEYNFVIIADHGNADHALNEDGSPNTSHSLNPVPCILISEDYKKVHDGILADVAPTLCQLLNIPQPQEMTGKSLIE